jgi:hypothetical protein
MKNTASLVFLSVGVVLIIYGINASDSVSSGFSRLFTGSPTDKTLWLTIGGIAAVVIGLGGLLRRSKP